MKTKGRADHWIAWHFEAGDEREIAKTEGDMVVGETEDVIPDVGFHKTCTSQETSPSKCSRRRTVR